jgi:hypothetical protein
VRATGVQAAGAGGMTLMCSAVGSRVSAVVSSFEVNSVSGEGITVAVMVASLAPFSWRGGGRILDR